jgi:hypothetical protein
VWTAAESPQPKAWAGTAQSPPDSETIERAHGENATGPELANGTHYRQAEIGDKAFTYLTRAGAQAWSHWALVEAVACREQALAAPENPRIGFWRRAVSHPIGDHPPGDPVELIQAATASGPSADRRVTRAATAPRLSSPSVSPPREELTDDAGEEEPDPGNKRDPVRGYVVDPH